MTQDDAAAGDGTPTTRRQRGAVACRRCRRLRVKCIREAQSDPCEACMTTQSTCEIPRKGDQDESRKWRSDTRSRKRPNSEMGSKGSPDQPAPRPAVPTPWVRPIHGLEVNGSRVDLEMPTQNEIIESCRIFVTSYFQLGFIPKASFLERVANHDVSEFLIICILCLSARFTPCMITRFGDQARATDFFHQKALRMVPQKMYRPSLENTQGFFLLSIAEWGSNDRERSSVHMGVAVRMAAMLKLHREETYQLKSDAREEEIITAEMGRRTFWMIQSQDNLHSGFHYPAPFAVEDISAMLPCEEQDFLFGVVPRERAALSGTVPALVDPALTDSPRRSLFATLIQAHSLWGRVARRACGPSQVAASEAMLPLSSNPDYQNVVRALVDFEAHLPPQQKWSRRNLRVWKDLGFDLAYLSVVMMLRLSNIIIRRIHLDDMKSSLSDDTVDATVREFWEKIANELFYNVAELYEQIDASFASRSKQEVQSYPAILVLPVYVCGSLALNLWKNAELCPRVAERAEEMLTRCLHLISDLQSAWPLARQWQQGLQQAATPLSTGPSPSTTFAVPIMPQASTATPLSRPHSDGVALPSRTFELSANLSLPFEDQDLSMLPQIDASLSIDMLPTDLFDAEVTAFLQGDTHYGYWDAVT